MFSHEAGRETIKRGKFKYSQNNTHKKDTEQTGRITLYKNVNSVVRSKEY